MASLADILPGRLVRDSVRCSRLCGSIRLRFGTNDRKILVAKKPVQFYPESDSLHAQWIL